MKLDDKPEEGSAWDAWKKREEGGSRGYVREEAEKLGRVRDTGLPFDNIHVEYQIPMPSAWSIFFKRSGVLLGVIVLVWGAYRVYTYFF